MCYWTVNNQKMSLVFDVRSGGNGVLLENRVLRAAYLVVRHGKEDETPFEATTAFCEIMFDQPRLPTCTSIWD